MIVLIFLVIWAACGFAGAKVMSGKGRSAVGGAVLGLLFGVFGIGAAACFSKTIEKKAEEHARIRSILGDGHDA